MLPLWMGIVFLFVTGQLFSGMLEGAGGVASTALSADVSASTLYIPISASSGLPSSASRMFIEDEEIAYDSIQSASDSNCSSPPCLVLSSGDRGINGTDSVAHDSGARVYTELTGLVNTANSFRVGEFENLDSPLDFASVPFQVVGAIGKFVAKAVMWDYSFLEGNGVYIKITLLYPLSAAFIISVIMLIRGIVAQ